jgi:bla regulator protein BlaR1
MENLFYNISQVLGITIIHSLWQGLIVYMALRLVLQFAPNLSATAKYRLSFIALGALLIWFGATLYTEVDHYTWLAATPTALPLNALLPELEQRWADAPATGHYSFLIAAYMPYITMLYLAGLVFNILKMALAWNNIYRIRQNVIEAGFQKQVNALSTKLGIGKFIKVAFSEFIDVPCITGYFKPLILLPLSISTYLTSQEIAAILLHELAHIKRNDYLLNLLQQAIGILLFFNPFSGLICRIINRERENCCDDMVVRTTGSPLIYAQALLKLEQNKPQDLHLALAATGKKYHLLNRIERIMKTKKTTVNIRPALIVLVLLTCSLSSIAWFNPKIENGKVTVKSIPTPIFNELFTDTVKPKVKAKTPTKVKPVTKHKTTKLAGADEEWNDARLEKLSAEAEMHAQAIDKYYNGPEFKKLQEEMEKKGQEMEAFYNSPKMKQWQEEMEKKGHAYDKMANNPDMKKFQDEMEASGKKIEAYYNSPAYKKIQKGFEEQAQLYEKAKPGTAEYKQREANFKKLADEMKDYANNPAIKEQIEVSKKYAKKMAEYYKSPEFLKQTDEMRAYGDSMSRAFKDNPALKEQQEEMRKLGEKMRDMQKSPEIMREKEELKRIEKEMGKHEKKRHNEKRTMNNDMDTTRNNVKRAIKREILATRIAEREIRERKEVVERREAPERKERPEIEERAVVRERTKVVEKARRPDTGRVVERKRLAPPPRPRKVDTSKVRERKAIPDEKDMAALPKKMRLSYDYQIKADPTLEVKKDITYDIISDNATKAKVTLDNPVKAKIALDKTKP